MTDLRKRGVRRSPSPAATRQRRRSNSARRVLTPPFDPPTSPTTWCAPDLVTHEPAASMPNAFYGSIFVDIMCVGMIVPFISQHALSLGVGPSTIGVVQAIYGTMQMLSTPILGTLCDVYGPRRILLLSVGGTSIAFLMLSWSLLQSSLLWFLASRVVIGSLRQTMCVGSAMVVSQVRGCTSRSGDGVGVAEEEAKVSKELGVFQSAASLGFVLGPAIGGVVGDQLGVVVATALAGGLDGINACVMWASTSAQRPSAVDARRLHPAEGPTTTHPPATKRNPLMLCWHILTSRDRRAVLLTCLYLCSLGNITLYATIPIVAARSFGLPARYVGLMISAASAINVLMLSVGMPRLLRKKQGAGGKDRTAVPAVSALQRRYATMAMLCSLLGYCIVWMSHYGALWLLVVGMCVVALTHGIADCINRSCFATMFPAGQSGEVLSIVFSIDGCNRVIAPLMSGFLVGSDGTCYGPMLVCIAVVGLSTWMHRTWIGGHNSNAST